MKVKYVFLLAKQSKTNNQAMKKFDGLFHSMYPYKNVEEIKQVWKKYLYDTHLPFKNAVVPLGVVFLFF